jgi:uncharacterized protein YraI
MKKLLAISALLFALFVPVLAQAQGQLSAVSVVLTAIVRAGKSTGIPTIMSKS